MMKKIRTSSIHAVIVAGFVILNAQASEQEFISRIFSDKIRHGNGTINLLSNISGSELTQYFNQTGGLLLLGANLKEANSGYESSRSVGVAIRDVQLSISTASGDFTFGDFFTSTTALLRGSGSADPGEYFTMFGQNGRSDLVGGGGFDLASMNDVLWMENILLSEDITRAEMRVTFVDTPKRNATATESFFDFSGGFEEFALLSVADAVLLEKAAIGEGAAPSAISFSSGRSAVDAIHSAQSAGNGITNPPAAPAPPWMVVAGLAGLLLLKQNKKHADA